MIPVSITILLLPLLSYLMLIFTGRKLPRGGDIVATGAILVSLILSVGMLIVAMQQYDPNFVVAASVEWFSFGERTINMGIKLDNLAIVMLVIVTLISSLVHIFSIGYMHGDSRYSRYFAFLGVFSFSMIGIVLADNLLGLYIFWELVGLSSYLLIGFWFEKHSASNAGMKAFLTNRIGDVGMLIGILIIFFQLGTLGLNEIFEGVAAGGLSGGLLTTAGICLFCGAIGKSAQFPLHVWLPDAMEGPTPVSALIHAATMVAAGVYMVARIFPLLTPTALLVVSYIGAITLFMAATIAIAQTDIKKVLAYSTVSQLGYMILALGTGAYTAGFFHLTTHAMFKACLFLCSGSVIHAVHSQEVTDMGGLKKKMPFTFWTFMLSTLAISGVPLTSGFLSKDMILAGALSFSMEHPQHFILPLVAFLGAGITAFYMFRLAFLTFFGEPKNKEKFDHAHESPAVMSVPLVILACLTFYLFYTFPSFNPTDASGGWFAQLIQTPASVAVDHGSAGHAMASLDPVMAEDAHGAGGGHHDPSHTIAMILSLLIAGAGIFLSWLTYFKKSISAESWAKRLPGLHRFLLNKWYFDELYHATVIRGLLLLNQALNWFDATIVDGIVNGSATVTRKASDISGIFDVKVVDGAVNGVATITRAGGRIFRRVQTGRLQHYLAGAMVGVLIAILLRLL
jgi:NADH-quinone oxidoreductase subunit L